MNLHFYWFCAEVDARTHLVQFKALYVFSRVVCHLISPTDSTANMLRGSHNWFWSLFYRQMSCQLLWAQWMICRLETIVRHAFPFVLHLLNVIQTLRWTIYGNFVFIYFLSATAFLFADSRKYPHNDWTDSPFYYYKTDPRLLFFSHFFFASAISYMRLRCEHIVFYLQPSFRLFTWINFFFSCEFSANKTQNLIGNIIFSLHSGIIIIRPDGPECRYVYCQCVVYARIRSFPKWN